MLNLQNPIRLGQVDEGKFNFPTSSSPKGEGVGELNFSESFPASSKPFLLDIIRFGQKRQAKIKLVADLYSKSALLRFYWLDYQLVPWWLEEKKEELGYETEEYWMRKIGYFNFISSNDYRRKRSFKKDINTGPCKLKDLVYGLSAFDVLAITIDTIVSEFMAVNPVNTVAPVSTVLIAPDKFADSSLVQEKTFSPTISYVLEEKAGEKGFYRNLMDFLFFYYEYEIPKKVLRAFLHLEDLLYDLYEFNISKFLSW